MVSSNFVRIEKAKVPTGFPCPLPIYVLHPKYPICPPGEDCVLHRESGHTYFSAEISRSEPLFFIKNSDIEAWKNHLRDADKRLVEALSPNVQIQRIQDVGMHLLEGLKTADLTPDVYQDLEFVADEVVSVLQTSGSGVRFLQGLIDHSAYTYMHSTAVSIIASAIAKKMGESDGEVLTEIALGGLLHDIGKLEIDHTILDKRDKLNDAEWAIMRKHPELGMRKLKSIDIPDTVKAIVYLHHEKMNGKGYPLGIPGDQIPEAARIVSVADIYSALTTSRPYRNKWTPFETLMLMKHSMKEEIWMPAHEALVQVIAEESKFR